MGRPSKYAPEVKERAIQMVRESLPVALDRAWTSVADVSPVSEELLGEGEISGLLSRRSRRHDQVVLASSAGPSQSRQLVDLSNGLPSRSSHRVSRVSEGWWAPRGSNPGHPD